jgi:hypothetical protein
MLALRLPTLVVLVCTAIACRPEPNATTEPPKQDPTPVQDPVATPAPETAPTIAAPWTVVVADGSANVYRCEHKVGAEPRFEYLPVTPKESSTGTYSGGPPRKGPMTAAQVDALWREIDAAVTNMAEHVEDRGKGTVQIEADGRTKAHLIVTGKGGAALMAVLAALPDAP